MNAPPDALVQALADRYRVERRIGEGGMATVYLASDLKHDRRVALKVLRPELAAVVGAERFISEIRTTANLQHPHILPLFDSGEDAGLLWYVMPYVDGESLEDRLRREKQLSVDEAVEIAVKVAGALEAAHEQGVVHRDIKPANILLGSRGEPRVADFGIALAVQEAGGGRLTETGLSLGTPWYMSPEQATADRDPDARSDVYALGCVLYEMLTGEPPFSGGTAQAVLGRILTADPEPPSTIRRSVPPHVDAAVLQALEKTPADRFPTAAAFADALRDPGFIGRGPGTRALGAAGGARDGGGPASPDGRRAAYTSVEGGAPQVQLRTFPEGLDPRTLGDGENPRWSADGRRVYFMRGVAGTVDDTLKVVELGPGGEPSAPRTLLAYDNWGFDVLPDGGLLLAAGTSPDDLAERGALAPTPSWSLVMDWLPSVRARLGR